MTTMTDDALAAALRAVLRDFDREPPDDYMPEAVRIFLAALPAHPPAPLPLDVLTVERVARAILACIEAAPSRKAWEDESIQFQAEQIVARLAAPEPTDTH